MDTIGSLEPITNLGLGCVSGQTAPQQGLARHKDTCERADCDRRHGMSFRTFVPCKLRSGTRC